ncbi:hypothetical protein N9O79_01490 [Luminiphilus sp.]|nr:hypothetical protein [Luminiphilus sp.]
MVTSYLKRVLGGSVILLSAVVVAEPRQSQVPESLDEALEMFDQFGKTMCTLAGRIYSKALTDRVNQVHLLTALKSAEQFMEESGLNPDFAEINVMAAYDAGTSITHLKGLEESEYRSAIFEAENEYTHQCIASDPMSPFKDLSPQMFDN